MKREEALRALKKGRKKKLERERERERKKKQREREREKESGRIQKKDKEGRKREALRDL
jgi:hypothetical protein